MLIYLYEKVVDCVCGEDEGDLQCDGNHDEHKAVGYA